VLRAAGETETTQENIQDWLQLDEGDPGFQLLTGRNRYSDLFCIYFHKHYLYIIKFSIYFLSFFLSCRAVFASLIRISRVFTVTGIHKQQYWPSTVPKRYSKFYFLTAVTIKNGVVWYGNFCISPRTSRCYEPR
jgi:hypothetical protein